MVLSSTILKKETEFVTGIVSRSFTETSQIIFNSVHIQMRNLGCFELQNDYFGYIFSMGTYYLLLLLLLLFNVKNGVLVKLTQHDTFNFIE